MKKATLISLYIFLIAGISMAQTKIACIGNSITEGFGLQTPSTQSYPARLQALLGSGYQVENEGVTAKTLLKNGDQPYWTQGKLSQVFTFKPNIVTIKLGTNDTKPQNWDTHYAEFKRDYLAMVDTLYTISTKPRIFVVLPAPIWPNTMGIRDSAMQKIIIIIKQVALERGLPVIDCNTPFKQFQAYFQDGVHPNAIGDDSIAHIMYRSITGSPAVRFQYCTYKTALDSMPYRLFVPERYSVQTKYPLVLCMHGMSAMGVDNQLQVQQFRLAEIWAEDTTQQKYKSFVLAPQCPTTKRWVDVDYTPDTLYGIAKVPEAAAQKMALAIADSMIRLFPIDTNRIYVTGLSMGGYATWDFIMRHPTKFAAAIPEAGGCDTSTAPLLKKMPIYSLHGAIDPTVRPGGDRLMMARLQAIGVPVLKYIATYGYATGTYFGTSSISRAALGAAIDSGAKTIYGEFTDGIHDIWVKTYNDPLLARWMFKQSKAAPVSVRQKQNVASRESFGASIVPIFATTDGRLSEALGRLAPEGRYELRVFDMKGAFIGKVSGKPSQIVVDARGLFKSALGIRCISLKKL
jgi:acyl-CoA thioesterase I